MKPDSTTVDPHKRVLGFLKVIGIVILIFSAIETYDSLTEEPFKSPFVAMEWRSITFVADVVRSMYKFVWSGNDSDSNSFHQYWETDLDGSPGFQYQSEVYREEIKFTGVISYTAGLIAPFFGDRIIDYWIQGFRVSQEKEVFSVCYRFKSGAVLQVADLYDIYGKPEKTSKPHKYRVVRMFFVGDRYKKRKYRKYFGKAYFETEVNIQHYKQLMKEGKGWVRQANCYIDEKELKEEKPVLDYRTNPDYYKPLSQRGK